MYKSYCVCYFPDTSDRLAGLTQLNFQFFNRRRLFVATAVFVVDIKAAHQHQRSIALTGHCYIVNQCLQHYSENQYHSPDFNFILAEKQVYFPEFGIGFPEKWQCYPDFDIVFSGNRYCFPELRIIFPGFDIRFPGKAIGFPGFEYYFPGGTIHFPGI